MMVLSRAPIRVRLTAWYVLLLAVILAAFGTGVYLLMRHSLYQNLEESIENRAAALAETVQIIGGQPFLAEQQGASIAEEIEHFNRVFDSSGEVTSDTTGGIGSVPINEAAIADTLTGGRVSYRVRAGPEEDSMLVWTFPVLREGRIVGVLEVGQSDDDASETLATLLLIMGIAYPVTLVLAGFGGAFLASRALAPVGEITDLAHRLSAEDLRQRLDLSLPDDEIGRLARTFDEMIGRLDEAFRRQRQFTADASHELRTPLTIIKGRIDVSLEREREPQAYRKVLVEVNEEVDRLIRLTGSLLTLTRADAGQIPLVLEVVEVGEIVTGVIEQVRPAAVAKGVELVMEHGLPPVSIEADEDLLLQLMLNLVDNAIKYTPSGGQVSVSWELNESQVAMTVLDTGIGIPPEHVDRLFDRFYRVDAARSRNDGGVGLGLAISRWIALAHGGDISVESTVGTGSAFTVLLPTVN
jgi:heavy metal sensor kinase